MTNEEFQPLIEGEIAAGGQPIFVKALTYGMRVIRLPQGFAKRDDHLRQAQRRVVAHYNNYMLNKRDQIFPILYYKYLVSPTRSVRISVTGDVLGVFEDSPANPSFAIGGREYEIAATSGEQGYSGPRTSLDCRAR